MSTGAIRLAITVGDVRGIGPEIVNKALADDRIRSQTDSGVLSLVLVAPDGCVSGPHVSSGSAEDYDAAMHGNTHGNTHGAAAAGLISGRAIEASVQLALDGEVDGIVTAPIDKAALYAGGYDFPGHTEMLGSLTGTQPAMMLASDRLRVVLATTHIALRDVPGAVTAVALAQAIETTRTALRSDLGIKDPRIALCALNPHAGDRGRFGTEDDDLLAPVAKEHGVAGPYPADTVFVRAMRGEFDAVVAPYHDVGMTAIKVASFGQAVNVTLGLPFPRTSPDHGTAMDIAGKGVADAESMVRAILLCMQIALRRRQTSAEAWY